MAASLYDEFVYLHNNPINWHEINQDKLKEIPALSVRERAKLLEISRKHPTLTNWDVIQDFTSQEVLEILKYTVRLTSRPNLEGHLRWRIKSSRTEDFQSYTRIRFSESRGIRGSVVTERDPGELTLLDHIAGGVEFGNVPHVDKLILGQFRMGYGLGVAFGPALGLSKSNNAISNIDRSYMHLRLNDSSLETLGFRGIASRMHFKNHHFQTAGALTPRDGSWSDGEIVISRSGLHRTAGSLSRKNHILERLENAGYWYSGSNLHGGIQYAQIHRRRQTDEEWLDRFSSGSIWIEIPYISHETGMDGRGNRAHLTTVQTGRNNVEAAFAHRWYAPNYNAPYASGFGEYSQTANETGWYAGLQVDFNRIRWSSYIDIFNQIVAGDTPPREGTEWLIRVDWRPRSRMRCSVSVENETKEVPVPGLVDGLEYDSNILRRKQEYQFRWRYRWDSGFSAGVRTETIITDFQGHREVGNQWTYKLSVPFGVRDRFQIFLVPYDVEDSGASTYYFVMPASGTMQLLRQTGTGLLTGGQIRINFSRSAETTIFYLQRRADNSKLTHTIAAQMDIAF